MPRRSYSSKNKQKQDRFSVSVPFLLSDLMSAAPKPKRTDFFSEQPAADGLNIGLTDESVASVLRGATFVSAQGRAYRLFAEETETTKLGENFSLKEKAAEEDRDVSHRPESLKLFATEASDALADSRSLVNILAEHSCTGKYDGDSDDLPAQKHQGIEDTFKRLRAVEGIIGRNQRPLSVQIFDNLSERISRKSNPTAKTQVSATNTKPFSQKKETKSLTKTLSLFSLTEQKPEVSQGIQEPVREKPSIDPAELALVSPFPLECFEPQNSFHPDSIEDEDKIAEENQPIDESQTIDIQDETQDQEKDPDNSRRIQFLQIGFPHSIKRMYRGRLFAKDHRKNNQSQDRNRNSKSSRPVLDKEILFFEPQADQVEEIESIPNIVSPGSDEISLHVAKNDPTDLGTSPEQIDETIVESILDTEIAFVEKTNQIVWQPAWPEHVDSLGDKASEQIQGLCDHLTDCMKKGVKAISFNSFYPGEGCTTSLICVARNLAARNHHVLMIDAHANHPELSELLSDPNDSLEYGIVRLENNLDFLPWTEIPIEMEVDGNIVAKNISDLLVSLYPDYDLVLIDNGRLSEGKLEERIAFWNKISSDGVLLVVNSKNADQFRLESVAARLKKYGVELIGLAENYV